MHLPGAGACAVLAYVAGAQTGVFTVVAVCALMLLIGAHLMLASNEGAGGRCGCRRTERRRRMRARGRQRVEQCAARDDGRRDRHCLRGVVRGEVVRAGNDEAGAG